MGGGEGEEAMRDSAVEGWKVNGRVEGRGGVRVEVGEARREERAAARREGPAWTSFSRTKGKGWSDHRRWRGKQTKKAKSCQF